MKITYTLEEAARILADQAKQNNPTVDFITVDISLKNLSIEETVLLELNAYRVAMKNEGTISRIVNLRNVIKGLDLTEAKDIVQSDPLKVIDWLLTKNTLLGFNSARKAN